MIGAGAAGVTLARRLMRAGKEVILLESAGTNLDAATQELYRGANLGLPNYPLDEARFHGYANLWVAGSSTFATAGWANPTLTLVALAIRLAERLSR